MTAWCSSCAATRAEAKSWRRIAEDRERAADSLRRDLAAAEATLARRPAVIGAGRDATPTRSPRTDPTEGARTSW